jgi:hypothetical protein
LFPIYFISVDHLRYKVNKYDSFALATVYPETELVEIPVDVKVAYPREVVLVMT